MKKALALTCAMTMAASLFLTGCGGNSNSFTSSTDSNSDSNSGSSNGSGKRVVNVCSWGEYIDEDLIYKFEDETGIKVNYQTAESNEALYSLLKTGAGDYDVIVPSDYMIARLIDEGMLAELNYDNIPNYAKIGEQYKSLSFDPENKYTVPYTWGTLGIIYNSTMVDGDIDSWDAMFDEKYADNVLMIRNSRDALAAALLAGCGAASDSMAASSAPAESEAVSTETPAESADEGDADEVAAKKCADLIDAIYVQERTDDTDAQCEAAKQAWDTLTDTQKELVEGENADPDYFGRNTGDANLDDSRNGDEIGENELLVVSFGTSFNSSRVADIKGIEDALQAAYPDWSVRRAFTAQIIINHVQARDGEKIDNMKQALDRAVANGVKNLVVQPTHLMHGAEYDEMCEAVNEYADKFESVAIAEPLLGEVGADATEINADKEAVATAITTEAVAAAGYDDAAAAAADGTAFVFMGHGTSHTAKISYSQMQMTMQTLGYDNVFIGTVEGEPEDTACEAVIEKIKEAGYTKVVLRPLMVVAGDHANNDMAGDDADSWLSQFKAAGCFDSVDTQIAGLGEIADVQQIYIDHTKAAIDSLNG